MREIANMKMAQAPSTSDPSPYAAPPAVMELTDIAWRSVFVVLTTHREKLKTAASPNTVASATLPAATITKVSKADPATEM
jgi:hypothetical protein